MITVLEGRKIGETVSADMLDMAAHLRKVAAQIEGGDTVATSLSWVTKNREFGCATVFDEAGHALLGAVTKSQAKLAMDLVTA